MNGSVTADFSLTNNPGALASLSITGGNNQSTTVNTAFANPLQVTAFDSFGNVIPNQNLTFNAPVSGASATTTLTPITTDSTGSVSVPVTANTVAGSYTASLLNGSVTADFSLTNNTSMSALPSIQPEIQIRTTPPNLFCFNSDEFVPVNFQGVVIKVPIEKCN